MHIYKSKGTGYISLPATTIPRVLANQSTDPNNSYLGDMFQPNRGNKERKDAKYCVILYIWYLI